MKSRFAIIWFELAKEDDRCVYCNRFTYKRGINADNDLFGTIDHLLPKSRGGKDSLDNLVIACRSCNMKKASATYEEFTGRVLLGLS